MRRPATAFTALAVALLLAGLHTAGATTALDHRHDRKYAYKVCPSMDIRNNVDLLQRLRNCTVIEGRLSIVLMERTTAKSFENISFPELREVTGYIQIYRLKGLRSLGDLFPNLTIVRGITLFRDYAIVIYDNENLQSLGLRSLAKVERGYVRIERNDRLCYTNSIDWSRIVEAGVENNIIRKNYDNRLCGLCPNAEGLNKGHGTPICPAGAGGRLLCWDEWHCQKLCPSACSDACSDDGQMCCHKNCVGGCSGTSQKDCHACRYFSLYDGSCVEKCPDRTYELLKRCVSEYECRNLSPASDGAPRYYKIFEGKCVVTCPSGYTEVGDAKNSTCRLCPEGWCYRECAGKRIDSVAAAEPYRGCTHVKGNLEISLRSSSGNTMAELESFLGEIREIDGALRVIRSHSLVSLSFLKSLRVIRGTDTNNKNNSALKKLSLYIFSNPNLELLWNWDKDRKIDILSGKLFIHFNPKLCYNLIEPLRNMTRDPDSTFDELEVSQENNGDQASCLRVSLHLSVSQLFRNFVVLTWNPYCLQDARKMLGYSIYYIEAEHNITQYERRDACFDSWMVYDVFETEELANKTEAPPTKNILFEACSESQPKFEALVHLTSFTRYAAYVKTYTTLQDKTGAQSQIIYFKTLPGQPSPPTNMAVESITPQAATVKWSSPTNPNGLLTMYYVEVQLNSYNRPVISEINYCSSPGALSKLITVRHDDSDKKKEPTPQDSGNDTCTCRADADAKLGPKKFTLQFEDEHAESIEFENALQNEVYVKQNPRNKTRPRHKRDTDKKLVILMPTKIPEPDMKNPNKSDPDGYVQTLYYELPVSSLSLDVGRLRHYTWYTVSVWACRKKDANETEEAYRDQWCSERAHQTFRTANLVSVDVVSNVHAEILANNKTLPEVNVTWEPPANPNGFVVAYHIHHAPVEPITQTDVGLHSCMSSEDYESNGRSYLLRSLAPGNYSIKVTPVTIGGSGNVSAEIFVLIPERYADSGLDWVWGVVGGCAVVLMVMGGGIWYARRGFHPHTEQSKLFASVNPEYMSMVYVPDDWEVPRSDIELLKELGQGSFGMVYEGIARNVVKGVPETRCAVKTVNEHATDRERVEFLNEASVMKAFDTHHVVRLLGVVSRGQPTLVVMELMESGDLKSYLRSHRPEADGSLPKELRGTKPPPSLQQITQMAIEIADGMAYLSAKKFVHRDLAARNCMVAGDLTVKVGDFGMTRDIYETDYYRKGSKGLLPVRWMSPESLQDGVFSSNSDVWSFGVVLWEMATLAMQPYQGLSNEQVLRYVVDGGVMERPEHCPDRLYELMRVCWAHRPAARPAFLQLVAELVPLAAPHFRQRSFFHTAQGQELYAQQRNSAMEEQEREVLNVGAVATGSASNLFGVSGRLATWRRELSRAQRRQLDDAAAEPLAPDVPRLTPATPRASGAAHKPDPNGVLPAPH